jgi:hypothetical protein
MVGHDMFYDGEAKACAGDLAAPALVGAVDALAEARQVFALDARALVLDAQPDRGIRRTGPPRRLQQRHLAAALRLQIIKTEPRDTEGGAHIMRTALHRAAHAKSFNAHRDRASLDVRT